MDTKKIRILYFLPDDGDIEECPNSFVIQLKPSEEVLSLAVLRKRFPLPGVYHFRAKRTYNGNIVWEDLVDDSQAVSIVSGVVTLKISRIGLLSRANSRSPNVSPLPLIGLNNHSQECKTIDLSPKPNNIIAQSSNDLIAFDFAQSSDHVSTTTSPIKTHNSKPKSPTEGYLDSLVWNNLNLDNDLSTSDSSPNTSSNKAEPDLSPFDATTKQSLANDTEHKPITSAGTQENWAHFMAGSGVSLKSLANEFEIY